MAFTQNGIAACNAFTYVCTYSDGTAIDSSVFNFNAGTRIFSVYTADVAKINLYTIMITGYIFDPNKKASITFNVDIRNNCENVVISKNAD